MCEARQEESRGVRPLLSIVIPTRNRAWTARCAIRQILDIPDERLELIVQDNSDGPELEEFMQTLGDERLRYEHDTELLSFVANFERAVSLVSGEYCCIIGDDDGVDAHILDCVQWMKENKSQALQYNLRAFYLWPDVTLQSRLRGTKQGGYFSLTTPSLCMKRVNVQKEFRRLLRNGGQEYLQYHLPKLYHGIIETDLLRGIKAERGFLFGGLSPDMYITTLLALRVEELVYMDYPLTLSGVAKGSGSADSGQSKHVGTYEDMPHLKGHVRYGWNCLIPKFYSVETVWADSMLAAITDERRYDLLRRFNLPRLSAYCFVRNRKYWPYVRSCMDTAYKNAGLWRLGLPFAVLAGPVLTFLGQVWSRAKRIWAKAYVVQGVQDSKAAVDLMNRRLNSLGIYDALLTKMKCTGNKMHRMEK